MKNRLFALLLILTLALALLCSCFAVQNPSDGKDNNDQTDKDDKDDDDKDDGKTDEDDGKTDDDDGKTDDDDGKTDDDDGKTDDDDGKTDDDDGKTDDDDGKTDDDDGKTDDDDGKTDEDDGKTDDDDGKTDEDDGKTDEDDGKTEPDNLIYNLSSELYLIREPGFDEDLFLEVMNTFDSTRHEIVKLAAVDSAPHAHEIVIGNTERAISKEAKRLLGRIDKNKDSDVGFYIYSDGSSVAIVFDDDPDGITATLAINYFLDNYIKDELILPKGRVYSEALDLVDDYGASVDEAYENEMWALMEETIGGQTGKNFVNSMKQFYSIYSSDMVIWLADLYEPSICICNGLYGKEECEGTKYCGTAGFYYSNSARDTAGFLPDVETTYQALMLLNSTGITRVSGGWKNMIDDDILASIGRFVQELQEEDGDFVHPQWAHLELGISRQSRDLKWATELLEMLDMKPYYTTKTGIPGIGAPSRTSSALSTPIRESAVTAVSRVVAVSSTLPELRNDVSFKAYLESLNIKYNSYGGGNQIASLLGQITARDNELAKEGASYRLIDILIDFLNENRNTETGTWDHTPKTDPNYSVYEGVNGLMKIASSYNTAKVAIPYAEEACNSAIEAITSSEKVGEIVDVYNPWHALTLLFNNLIEFGGSSGRSLVENLRQTLYSKGPEMLSVTGERVLMFVKTGGCFSYNKDYSASNSQGCPAAVIYSREGDVNGTVLASSGLLDYMYSALGLKSCKVPLFGETERIMFMEEIRSLNPGKKPPEDLSYEVEGFEEDEVGEEPIGQDISYKTVSENASIKVVKRDGGEGNALRIDSNYFVNNSESVTVKCRSLSNIAKTFVFEGDFCVLNTNRQYSVQVKMGSAYMFAIKFENDKLSLWECSSSSNSKSLNTKFDETPELGDWFRIKVEYYRGDADTVRIKFYYDNLEDDEGMKLIAVTDNYYDEKGYKLNGGSGTPSSLYENTLIYVLSDATVSMMIDNVASYKTNDEYTPVTDPNNQPSFNVDAPDRSEEKHSYEDGSIPEKFTVSGNISVTEKDANKLLGVSSSSADARITMPLNLRTKTANSAVLDTLVYVENAEVGKTAMRIIGNENTGNVFGYALICEEDSGGKYLAIYEYAGELGAKIPGAIIPIGDMTRLRIEYYNDNDTSLVYLNDEFVGASGAIYTGAATRSVTRMLMVFPKSESSLMLDDTVCERNYLDFSEATKPKNDSDAEDFDDVATDMTLEGGAAVTKDGTDSLLKLDSVNSSFAAVCIPVNKRSDISSVAILEAAISLSTPKGSGVSHRILFVDALGETVYALLLVVSDGRVGVYEVCTSGMAISPLCGFDVGETVKLRIEYFSKEKTTYIYINDVVVAESGIVSYTDTYRNAVDSIRIESADAGSVLALDDLKAETVYESFTEKTVQPEKNTESGKITFEKSSNGSLPGHLISTLNSDAASLRIEELLNSVTGETSKGAIFKTGAENNDSLGISAEESLDDCSMITFEVDFKIESSSSSPLYQIFFSEDRQSADDIGYLIFIDRNSDGTLVLSDYSRASKADGKHNVLVSGIDAKVWNRLRIEFYKGSKDSVRIKIYFNDKLEFVSDNYFGYSLADPDSYPEPNNNIKNVYFYSFLSTVGTMYVDNMSLVGSDGVCLDEVGDR